MYFLPIISLVVKIPVSMRKIVKYLKFKIISAQTPDTKGKAEVVATIKSTSVCVSEDYRENENKEAKDWKENP